MVKVHLIWLSCMLSVLLSSCSLRSMQQARSVVAEADSLRCIGTLYDDSVSLAAAAHTLRIWQYLYPTDYARSQYLYGRMLRQKKDYLPAMKALYAATQTIGADYEYKARAYDNMACICCVSDATDLARELFHQSGECFLKKGDSTAYVFSLNNIAYTYTNKNENYGIAVRMVDSICGIYHNPCFELALLTTKAKAFIALDQNDSALYYCDYLISNDYHNPWVYMLKMQAFSNMSQNDSASYYAKLVLQLTDDSNMCSNAYYVLTNMDDSRDIESIREISSLRADLHLLFESERVSASSAAEYISLTLSHKIYRFFGVIVLLLLLVTVIVYRTLLGREKNSLVSLLLKERKLLNQQHNISNAQMAYFDDKLKNLTSQCGYLLQLEKNHTIDLSDYERVCRLADEHLFLIASKLKQRNILKDSDLHLCLLVLIGLSRSEIAEKIRYSASSIGKLKNIAAKSLGTTGKDLRNYLIDLAIGKIA